MHILMKMFSKRKMSVCVVAVFMVALILVGTFAQKEKTLVYDIVVLGDSIAGNPGEDGKTFSEYLAKNLEVSVLNGGLGGTAMALESTNMWGSLVNSEWSMVKLAEAIAYNDWKSPKATMAYAENYKNINYRALDYFAETMDKLSKTDFSRVKILIMEHGTNDYNAGRPLDNPEDKYDTTTYGGAMRKSLRLLKEAYPDLRIIVVSPLYCALGDNHEKKCYNTKYGDGGFLEEYVALEMQIAKDFNVEFLDTYHESGIWEENASEYLVDYLHLNANGHKLMGDFIAEYLQNSP